MTEAVRAMTPWASSEFGLCRLFAGVFETDPTSARVLERAGYTFEGRLRLSIFKGGRMLDQLLYAYVTSDNGDRKT